jgi:HNH endonuclease/Mrr restriction endonuclease-like protein
MKDFMIQQWKHKVAYSLDGEHTEKLAMPFPTRKEIELPLLREIVRRGGIAKPSDLYDPLAAHFNLTEEDRTETTPKLHRNKWHAEVSFARYALIRASELDGTEHGVWRVTSQGKARAANSPPREVTVSGKKRGARIGARPSPRGHVRENERLIRDQERELENEGVFNPESIDDCRERIMRSVVLRRGQPAFREMLMKAYERRCAITGCDVEEALEAAHIIPYQGPPTNHRTNGLLLRGDLHTLFDLGLIAIDTETMTVIIARSLANTSYADLAGQRLRSPRKIEWQPSTEALDEHREWAGFKPPRRVARTRAA